MACCSCNFFNGYFAFVKRFRIFIMIFWMVMLVIGGLVGTKVLDKTKTTFDAPAGTPSHDAQVVFSKYFSDRPNTAIFLIHNMQKQTSINDFTEKMYEKIKDAMKGWPVKGQYNETISYYSFEDPIEREVLGMEFVSHDKTSMIIDIAYYPFNNQDEAKFLDFLLELKDKLQDPTKVHKVGLTGLNVLFYEVVKTQAGDVVRTDSIVIPIALSVLAYTIRSLRLMIIPVLGVFSSLLTSWLILLPIAQYAMEVASFAPSIMSSLTVAMSIDYSLFQLTRYGEEIKKGRSNEVAVRYMAKFAGHIVLVSGSTLAITFLGLAFFPMSFLQSIGIGAAIALTICIIVNLTFVPAVLLTFGNFFSDFELPGWFTKYFASTNNKKSEFDSIETDHELSDQLNSSWYHSARFSTTTTYSWLIILLVFAGSVPMGLQMLNMSTTIDNTQLFPKEAISLEVYKELQAEFSAGRISPYLVVMTSNDQKDGVKSEAFFAAQAHLIDTLVAAGLVPMTGYSSIAKVANHTITWKEAEQYLVAPGLLGDAYRLLWHNQVDAKNLTAIADIVLDFDPLGDEAEPWVKKMRTTMEKLQPPHTPYSYYLTGGAAQAIDAVDRIYQLFPIEIVVTGVLVFLIVGFMFKSVFVPFRLLITIALPICLVFGLGVLAFENGLLFPKVAALFWLTPVMSFSILVGLGLDYDVFLFSRVVEYRSHGYTNRASILKGIYKTGRIITAAGVIMSIAFAGLLFSKQMVLNQFGFMLCIAVLVDTFVVRTLMVPAIMHLAGQVNWWPGKMPPQDKDEKDMEGDYEVDDEPGNEQYQQLADPTAQ